MNQPLREQLQAVYAELAPQFHDLRAATGALQVAERLAAEDKPEALAMQKAMTKLGAAAERVTSPALAAATGAFAEATQAALDELAFVFARDLKDAFEARGRAVQGRPPALVVDPLVLQIDMAARRAQWFYGREALTRFLPLSVSGIQKAYEAERKAIAERALDAPAFLAELHSAWQALLEGRARRPAGNRVNLVELYSKVTMDRQSARFWNAPSRATFKDYPRALFVRDLVLVQRAPQWSAGGDAQRLRLGVATKSQADSPARSIWLPSGPQEGEYYADATFEPA